MEISLDGWDIGVAEAIEWTPWGSGGNAKAKVIAQGEGYVFAFVDAEPGYQGEPHEHAHPEFLYVIDGSLRTQGRQMNAGDAYVAATGSTHADFATEHGARYLSIFKL